MIYKDLLQYARHLSEFLGGCVEARTDSVMEAVFPLDVARHLNLDEYYKFCLEPSPSPGENDLILNYNSSILEQLGLPLKDKMVFSRIFIPDLYLKKAGFEELFTKRLSFVNSACKIIEIKPSVCSYLIFNFKYAALSEERKEGLASISINEHNSFLVNNLCAEFGKLFIDGTPSAPAASAILPSEPLKVLFSTVSAAIEKNLKEELRDFRKSLNHRLEKDIKRLGDYFGAISKEINKKIAKKKAEHEDFNKERSKLSFTERELERKIFDQKARYQINVNLKLFSALRLIIPVVALNLLLRCKKNSRKINLVWNPILKELELPSCKKCFSPVSSLFLDEESLAILCPKCRGSG